MQTKNFPEKNPQDKRKSQSPNLSLRLRDHRSGEVYSKLGGDNDCVKKPMSRKENTQEKEKREGKT